MKIVSIAIAVLIFSIIVLFHELGHFLFAKANGIRVNEFSLGLGKTIFGIQKGETKYSIKLFPFGGACIMEGEEEDSSDNRAFYNKSVWARMSVVVAGPLFNFIMAYIFAVILIICIGYDKPVIKDVIDGYAAQEAGIKAGDEVVKINDSSVHFYREISMYSMFHAGEKIDVTLIRDGEKITKSLTPKFDEETGRYLYGFKAAEQRVVASPLKALAMGAYEVKYWISYTLQNLKILFSGGYTINQLSGPVGIVNSIGTTYKEAVQTSGYYLAFLNMMNWVILLSANLGVMNLIPFPALDGGKLFIFVIEAIRKKRIDPEKEAFISLIGIVILFGFMIVIMFNDIKNIIM